MIRTTINKHELGLVFRNGDLRRVLAPGRHLVRERLIGGNVQRVNRLVTRFDHPLLDVLAADPALRSHLTVVDLEQNQRAIVWRDGRLYDFVAAGRFAYWSAPYRVKVEVFEVDDQEFVHPQRDAILTMNGASDHLRCIEVESHERVLVRRGGELAAVLDGGRHAFWSAGSTLTWQTVDLREQIADVAGQEIMTADKVTLRLNLVVGWRVTDPLAATATVQSADSAIYREAQLALRATVGGRDLEQLLADKNEVAAEIRAIVARRAAEFGVAVSTVGIRDIVLPGEMKTILNQVIQAQKQAEANLIRRREETAAARSQANTARLLADHPVLMRMKELEALEAILRDARTTFVFGNGDLTTQVKSLIADGDGD
ncbi:MAG: slipin family protein [bacterium]|nr:slipin family protein [bacterium]